MNFNACCVVPSRNHYRVVGEIVGRARQSGLPVFVIDDASDEPARAVLAGLHAPADGIVVTRLDERGGKGGAVIKGMELAAAAGFTHVVQLDADGQHDIERLPELLALAAAHPAGVVSGAAFYDDSVPRTRRYARYLTHVWVWIETLSFQIADSMCGFRVYPLAAVMPLLSSERVGRFMDFDVEIMVRLSWRGVRVIMLPLAVVYPAGNSSNFDLWRDNWRITKMHIRLVFAMLTRLPSILANRRRAEAGRHWSSLAERGMDWGISFLARCYLFFGRTACRAAMTPVVLYFYLTDAPRRRVSRAFLTRALALAGEPRRPGMLDPLRHYLDFGEKMLETFAAWVGGIPPDAVRTDDAAAIAQAQASTRGALLIVSHLGNADLSRALLGGPRQKRLTVLVHTRYAEHYNRVLNRFQPGAATNLLQVTEIGPDTGVLLQERISRGEWVAIAGDRTPVGGGGRISRVPFLGAPAAFSNGPYILAHLLGCPVYLLFCLRGKGGYRLHFEEFAARIELPRAQRDAALAAHAGRYAARLAYFAERAPFQWYNFFDFWAD
jgi:predicted LPLAT superfamily acyltransferase/GT2 family glycosyltransferase